MRQILCTRSIDPALLDAAAKAGAEIRMSEFIRVEGVISPDAERRIEALAAVAGAPVVFTSSHAVKAVAGCLEALRRQPRWQLYCISEVTARVAARSFAHSTVSAAGSYALEVARRIVEDGITGEVWFFSGDRRRDTLVEQLSRAGLDVREKVVYRTMLTPHAVPGFFDGILFFSPSGVESYFSRNRPDPRTVLFAIGDTTAGALRAASANTVVVSPRQEAGALVKAMTDYFTQN
jgi:uroporphyrinogen-III synthase